MARCFPDLKFIYFYILFDSLGMLFLVWVKHHVSDILCQVTNTAFTII